MDVGLVGCGRVAERGYVPALASAGMTLAAVADVDRRRCGRVAPGIPQFGSARELIESVPVDLLVVATPSSAHVSDAEAAAERGVRALVEKPPAPSAEQARALALIDPVPWIGFNRRFEPKLGAIRSAMREHGGAFGLRILLTIDSRSWGAYASVEGPLLDLGSHAVDLVMWLTGESVSRLRVRSVEPASLGFELGLDRSTASITVAHDRSWRERVEVVADGRRIGRFEAGGLAGRLASRVGVSRAASLPELLTLQLQAAARTLDDGEPDAPLASAHDGWMTMLVLDHVRAACDGPLELWQPHEMGKA